MIDSKFVGHRFKPSTLNVQADRVRAFASAIGATDPIHFDAAAAQVQGYPDVVAPPTFLTIAEMDRANDPQFETLPALLGLALSGFLHGEQEYEYLAPVCAGDSLAVDSFIKDIYSKRNGALQFIVMEFEYRNAAGALAAISRSTAVYRGE